MSCLPRSHKDFCCWELWSPNLLSLLHENESNVRPDVLCYLSSRSSNRMFLEFITNVIMFVTFYAYFNLAHIAYRTTLIDICNFVYFRLFSFILEVLSLSKLILQGLSDIISRIFTLKVNKLNLHFMNFKSTGVSFATSHIHLTHSNNCQNTWDDNIICTAVTCVLSFWRCVVLPCAIYYTFVVFSVYNFMYVFYKGILSLCSFISFTSTKDIDIEANVVIFWISIQDIQQRPKILRQKDTCRT